MTAGCGHPPDGVRASGPAKPSGSNSNNEAAVDGKEPGKTMTHEATRIETRDQLPLLVGKRVAVAGIVVETKGRVFIKSSRGDFGVDLNPGSHNIVDKHVKVIGTLARETVHSLPRQPASRSVQTSRYRDTPEQWDRYYITDFIIAETRETKAEVEDGDQLKQKAIGEKDPWGD
jgi:hypothetical protein